MKDAYTDFLTMIERSWTYGRMTDEEKRRCMEAFSWALEQGAIKGADKTRWMIMQAIYNAFLQGIGYDPFHWREPEAETAAPMF